MFSFLYNNIIYNEIEYFTFLNIWLIILFIYLFIYLFIINITLLFLSTIKLNNNYIELINTLFSIIFLLIIISPALLILLEIDINILPSFIIQSLAYQWSWTFNILILNNDFNNKLNYNNNRLNNNNNNKIITKIEQNIIIDNNSINNNNNSLNYNNKITGNTVSIPDSALLSCKCAIFSFLSNFFLSRQFYLFDVNNYLLIPIWSLIKIYIIGIDVIHSFGFYTFGIKIDAIPGRINVTIINKLLNKGEHRGFCYELCGNGHSVMLLVSLSMF